MGVEQGSTDPDKKVDIRPVRLNELEEVPKIISGKLYRVNFADHRGYPDPDEFILVDPVFEDKTGRVRSLAGDPDTTPLFWHRDVPRNQILSTNRWVTLDQIERQLKKMDQDASTSINIVPMIPSSEPAG